MNGQNFGEHVITSDIVEETDPGTNGPLVVNSDPFTDNVPVDAVVIHEAPMGETVAAVDPMDETIVQEAPMGETILYKGSVGETITHETPISSNAGPSAALLDREESEHLRVRWNEIQGKFVDEPRSAVQQADELVSEVIEKITQMFTNEHSSLEGQWKQGNDVSTEDLRKALQRYRSFFNRLVV
jgi:hypothetical protein